MIIIIYIILAARANYEKDFRNIKTINLHYDEINTGDLLFVYYDINYHIHSLMSAVFGHVCICSREDSNLYVYEYHNYFYKYYGLLKLPFSEWLKYNRKNTICINKLKIKEDSKYKRNDLSNKLNKFRRKNNSNHFLDFNQYISKYIRYNENKIKTPKKTHGIPCYQLIVHMLKDSGIILNSKFSIYNMKPDDLICMDKFNLNKNYNYDEFNIANINSLRFIMDY